MINSLGEGLTLLMVVFLLGVPLLLLLVKGKGQREEADILYGIPEWADQLPEYMRPTPDQINQLEALRQQVQVPHEAFYLVIAGHPATTRKVQYYHYNELKSQQPDWSHYQILEALIRSRWSAGMANGYDLFGLGGCSPEEMENKITKIAKQAGTVDALANLFVEAEGINEIPPLPDYEWARAEVDRILGESEEKIVKAHLTSGMKFGSQTLLKVSTKTQTKTQRKKFVGRSNKPQNAVWRSVSEYYVDFNGKKQTRGRTDFESLLSRHIEVIFNLPRFQEDKELVGWLGYSRVYYDQGEYGETLQYLKWSLRRMPALEPYIFYYIRVCAHVLSIPLTEEEMQYEAKLSRYLTLPRWLRWTMPGFEFHMRCKWCGRYTHYIHPDVPTFGFDTYANSCLFCGRMYPMPSWLWDSPDGRAYSYYRMSFSGDDFYEEFERDYDPKPLCQHRRKQRRK